MMVGILNMLHELSLPHDIAKKLIFINLMATQSEPCNVTTRYILNHA